MPAMGLLATLFPFFFLCIFGGLLPPFLDLFNMVLKHYQIYVLHLHPKSIFLLTTFAYLCKVFLGIMPSLSLFCTFHNMRCKEGSTTGCASFRMVDRMSERCINMISLKKVDNLKVRWIYMEVCQCNPLFVPPIQPHMKSSGWGESKMEDAQLGPIAARLQELRAAGPPHRPLQKSLHPMWEYQGCQDRTKSCANTPHMPMFEVVLHVLFVEAMLVELPTGAEPLYVCGDCKELHALMGSEDVRRSSTVSTHGNRRRMPSHRNLVLANINDDGENVPLCQFMVAPFTHKEKEDEVVEVENPDTGGGGVEGACRPQKKMG
ncbi:hypothetical protein D1007_01802 [Hordeum vulgare]|nr:hypothetical protein D1007_01802 [Hordeum vulgare]